MRRLSTIVLVVAAGVAAAVATSGSAYAGQTSTTVFTPASTMTRVNVDYQDDMMTGCGSHRADRSTSTAP